LIAFDESIDVYNSANVSQNVIERRSCPRQDSNGNCIAIYPSAALRSNTIFEVVRAHAPHRMG